MRHKQKYERECESCYGCAKIGDRTYACDDSRKKVVVIKDGKRTKHYLHCRDGKQEINKFTW